MRTIDFFFDVVSPYTFLAFEHQPEALAGISYQMRYRPVLFAGLLKAVGNRGPAEMELKRAWMHRQIGWLASHHGVPLQWPAVHPFNPLALLRLSLACTPAGCLPNRRVVEAVLRHVWQAGGADPNDPDRLAELQARLQPQRDPSDPLLKDELRRHTEAALAAGVFGVPSWCLAEPATGALAPPLWGLESLPMLREALQAEPSSLA
ncbi:2-hydroxychromene-2-carboxylate isomerase [Ideonella sp.]|uniref:2-hydroxychromene-2-carboxylate isomerase n=1 Tax=Ideonella sp. TaxID=1929293 RepID=UPI003BB55B6C